MSDNEITELAKVAGDFHIGVAQGVAAVALTMAMKYHDMNTVQDGALYQQYKLEGRNFENLSLGMVFETAKLIELHLMAAGDRLSDMVIDAMVGAISEDDATP